MIGQCQVASGGEGEMEMALAQGSQALFFGALWAEGFEGYRLGRDGQSWARQQRWAEAAFGSVHTGPRTC